MSDSDDQSKYGTAILLAVIGLLLGAPAGAALTASAGAFLGGLGAFFAGLGDAFEQSFPFGFLFECVENVGIGAGRVAAQWAPAGAKAGPIVGGIVGYLLPYLAEEEKPAA